MQFRPSGVVGYLLGVAGFAGAYYLAPQAGYELQFTGSISAIWPPAGLAVALPQDEAFPLESAEEPERTAAMA